LVLFEPVCEFGTVVLWRKYYRGALFEQYNTMFVRLIISSSNRVCLALLFENFNRKVIKNHTKKKEVLSNDEFRLAIIQQQSGAIDVGSTMMMVSYADQNGEHHLLETSAYTDDLEGLAITLQAAGVQKIAMEATGVYWMALYELLEHYAIEVTLVNPHHFKNVDGQKTDVKDCQWLHQLQAHGLLRASHIAPEAYRELRDYIHERNILQKQKSDTLNRIQKLLTRMNIKVQHLISDIEGVSGMRLLRGIAQGIENAEQLLSLIDVKRLKADKTDLIKSLKGNFKSQYICILKSTLKSYDFFKTQMREYEELI
jgi:transposase